MPNPPFANPRLAEKAPAEWCGRGLSAYWRIPNRFLSFPLTFDTLVRTRSFRFQLLKSVVLHWFMVSFLPFSMVVHLPNLGSQCKEPCETTKFKSDFVETPVIFMPENVMISMPNMTGRRGCRTMEVIGGSSVSYLARAPCVPLFSTLFNRGGNRRVFRLPGEGRDRFHCTVEPSPGHTRCQ